jgi:hypothetical protein
MSTASPGSDIANNTPMPTQRGPCPAGSSAQRWTSTINMIIASAPRNSTVPMYR